MQTVKQPVQGRTSHSAKRNFFSFQTNYDSCNSTSFVSEGSMSVKMSFNQKRWKRSQVERWKFSSASIPLDFLCC